MTENAVVEGSAPVALVTGGSRGIGAAIARELGSVGMTVAVNFHSGEGPALQVAASLRDASIWRADVASRDETRVMIQGVLAAYGRLDSVVVNAGVWRGGRIEQLSDSDWSSVLRTNLDGVFNVCAEAVPILKAQRRGRIVVISSALAGIGSAGDCAYSASKAGAIGLVRSLSKEVGPYGVTVNAVAPGYVDTDMTASVRQGSLEALLRRCSIREPIPAAEIARLVRFLCSDVPHMTGQTLVIDGGLSL